MRSRQKQRKRKAIYTLPKFDTWLPPVKVKPSKKQGPTVNPRVRPRHCFWCDVYLTPYLNDGLPQLPTSRTIDHVIPLSKGGRNIRTNRVPSCFECNQAKADRDPELSALKMLGLPYDWKKVELKIDLTADERA